MSDIPIQLFITCCHGNYLPCIIPLSACRLRIGKCLMVLALGYIFMTASFIIDYIYWSEYKCSSTHLDSTSRALLFCVVDIICAPLPG